MGKNGEALTHWSDHCIRFPEMSLKYFVTTPIFYVNAGESLQFW